MVSSSGQTGSLQSPSGGPYSTICCSLLLSMTLWLFLNGFHFFLLDFPLKMVTSPLLFLISTTFTGEEGDAMFSSPGQRGFSSSEGLVGSSSPEQTGFSSSESLGGSSSPGQTGTSSRIVFEA